MVGWVSAQVVTWPDAGGQRAVAVDVVAGQAAAAGVVGRRAPVEGDGGAGLGCRTACPARSAAVVSVGAARAVDLEFGS